MGIGKFIDAVEERQYLAVVLEETYYRLVESRQLFVWLVTTGIVCAAAVEHIATAIARLVLRNAFAIRKTEDAHHERSLAIIFGKCSGTIFRMSLINVTLSGLISVSTFCHRLFFWGKLRELRETAEQIHHVRIRERVEFHEFAQVLYCWRYAVEEMLLALEIATESVCA